jgi:hypothetical protein
MQVGPGDKGIDWKLFSQVTQKTLDGLADRKEAEIISQAVIDSVQAGAALAPEKQDQLAAYGQQVAIELSDLVKKVDNEICNSDVSGVGLKDKNDPGQFQAYTKQLNSLNRKITALRLEIQYNRQKITKSDTDNRAESGLYNTINNTKESIQNEQLDKLDDALDLLGRQLDYAKRLVKALENGKRLEARIDAAKGIADPAKKKQELEKLDKLYRSHLNDLESLAKEGDKLFQAKMKTNAGDTIKGNLVTNINSKNVIVQKEIDKAKDAIKSLAASLAALPQKQPQRKEKEEKEIEISPFEIEEAPTETVVVDRSKLLKEYIGGKEISLAQLKAEKLVHDKVTIADIRKMENDQMLWDRMITKQSVNYQKDVVALFNLLDRVSEEAASKA